MKTGQKWSIKLIKRLLFILLSIFFAHASLAASELNHLKSQIEQLTPQNCVSLSLDLNQKLKEMTASELLEQFKHPGAKIILERCESNCHVPLGRRLWLQDD